MKNNSKIKQSIFVIGIIIIAALMGVTVLRIGMFRAPIGIDYADFYATGKMIIEGQISDIYNMPVHHAYLENFLRQEIPYLLEWIYPPTFLLVIVPLAYIPYYFSLSLWLLVTLALAVYAIYMLTKKHKFFYLGVLTFPGIFMNIRWGQNGFLNTALIGFGLYFVESNPIMSGLMFGLLTYKPQIAIIPFVILFFAKKWKVLGWSIIFSLAMALLAGIVFGFDTWIDFISTSSYNASMLNASWSGTSWGVPTLYTSLRCMGLSGVMLNAILVFVAIASVIACIWVWKKTENINLRGSALVLAIFLSIPYLSLYDMAMLNIPLVLLFYDIYKNGSKPYEVKLLIFLWFLPIICLALFLLSNIQISPFFIMAILISVIIRVKNEKPTEKTTLKSETSATITY